ncbi:unnamed protein product [Meganyctiphanes norvegica]|uniref:Ribosomal protein n=1 Tax=Meganyctiphanes norvegica TaxID=48144 RepID=A0AAV2R3X6_MEGNR
MLPYLHRFLSGRITSLLVPRAINNTVVGSTALVPELISSAYLSRTFVSVNPSQNVTLQRPLLQATLPILTQTCGMKMKGKLRRRCKDCYFVWREGRFYVMCKSKGRHKQMSMVKKEKNTWILTHATQGTARPW